MIEFVKIHKLGIIDDALIEFGPGLTVLTGETGAGKTMVLSALKLLLGGKSDQGLAAAKETMVQGGWMLAEGSAAWPTLTDAGVTSDTGELLLTRTLPSVGRSRCAANGTIITQAIVAEIADNLVAIHGQAEQGLLRKLSRQREVLDRFGGEDIQRVRGRYTSQFQRVVELDAAYRDAVTKSAVNTAELADLQEKLERIESIDPQPNEDEQLADIANRLTNVSALADGAQAALNCVLGEDAGSSATSLVNDAVRSVDSVSSYDPDLAPIAAQLRDVAILLSEVGIDLTRYLADLDAQPGELERVQRRRAELGDLARSLGTTVAEIGQWSQTAALRVDVLERSANLEVLAEERLAARAELSALADELTALRQQAADVFSQRVTAEIRGLAMPHSRLTVALRHRQPPAGHEGIVVSGSTQPVAFGPNGVDEVEFLLAAHDSAAPAPVSKAASGGELSRIMLALEVVLAESATATTFVFDEVDAGVGGKAAVEIGRRLAALGRYAQVLVVTHLPQVAAFADNHLVVMKRSDGTITTSGVTALDDAERVRELARMLAGQEESQHAAAHAQELLDIAEHERSAAARVG